LASAFFLQRLQRYQATSLGQHGVFFLRKARNGFWDNTHLYRITTLYDHIWEEDASETSKVNALASLQLSREQDSLVETQHGGRKIA
jgi:hypothetical protein